MLGNAMVWTDRQHLPPPGSHIVVYFHFLDLYLPCELRTTFHHLPLSFYTYNSIFVFVHAFTPLIFNILFLYVLHHGLPCALTHQTPESVLVLRYKIVAIINTILNIIRYVEILFNK